MLALSSSKPVSFIVEFYLKLIVCIFILNQFKDCMWDLCCINNIQKCNLIEIYMDFISIIYLFAIL